MVMFLWPWALLLMPLPFLLLRRKRAAVTTEHAVAIPPRLALALDELQDQPKPHRRLPDVLLWLVWVCLVIATAQPQWSLGKEIQTASGRSIMLAIDLSGSMEKKDFRLDGQALDRLEMVKTIAGDFILRRAGDRVGLVLFGDDAFVASPLSFDLGAAKHALAESEIGMAGRTTALGNALGLALKKSRDDNASDKAVILLTDGSKNAGNVDPLSAAELASRWDIRVHTIGLGSRTHMPFRGQDPSAELDITTLKDIARISGGEFFRAENTTDLQQIYAQLDQMETGEHEAPPLRLHRDIRHYFLIAALLLLLVLIGLRVDLRRAPR